MRALFSKTNDEENWGQTDVGFKVRSRLHGEVPTKMFILCINDTRVSHYNCSGCF